MPSISRRIVLLMVLILIGLGAGVLRRAGGRLSQNMLDEGIAHAVMVKVLETGSLDTNWIRTDVPAGFKENQYNFSSYYLAAVLYEELTQRAQDDLRHQALIVAHVREFSALLGGLCALFAGLLAWRMGGSVAALVASLLTASCATLLQDGFYARPETFATLLSLLFMLLLASRARHRRLLLAAAGLVLGILVACKITFLAYFPLALMLAPAEREPGQATLQSEEETAQRTWAIGLFFLCFGLGFALGVPYALRFPWEYLEGLASLLNQYQAGVLHSADASDLYGRVAHNLAYLLYTVGWPALLLALGGAAVLAARRQWRYMVILAGPLLLLAYFLRAAPLFERNFSQSLPALFVLAGIGVQAVVDCFRDSARRLVAASVLGVGCLLVPLLVSARLIHPALDGSYWQMVGRTATALAQNGRVAVISTEIPDASFCGPYIYMLEDRGHRADIRRLTQHGFQVVARTEGPFEDAPTSTLQSYYAPTVLFMAPPQTQADGCELSLAPLPDTPKLTAVTAQPEMQGDWKLNGANAGVPSKSWRWPLYGSWSGADSHTGSFSIGPFHTCKAIIVPYATAPGHAGVELKIIRQQGKASEVLFDGIPPGEAYTWEAMQLNSPAGRCVDYVIDARDVGGGWGQWLGIGQPVQLSR